MTYPGLGGQQPPPQNAPAGAALTPGVTPGTTGIVVATKVIIIGSGGELLVYSPTAAAGNLIASIAGSAGTDPYGNSFLEGITSYQWESGSQFAESLSTPISSTAALTFDNLASVSSIPPAVYGNAESGSGTFDQIVISSGQATGGDTASSLALASAVGGGAANLQAAGAVTIDANSGNMNLGATGNVVITASGGAVSMTGAAVTCQSLTTAGDAQVQGSQLEVGTGSVAAFILSPKIGAITNYPNSHISTTPTAAEFNAIVDTTNDLIGKLVSLGMIA